MTDETQLFEELAATSREIETLQEELRARVRLRDKLIAHLSESGYTRRRVADAAGVTVGRVQQVLDRTGARAVSSASAERRPNHLQALARANHVRLARAELRRRVATGEIAARDVILESPWEAESMTVADLLMSQRRWGITRCRKTLAQIPISETKTIGSLTDRQRVALALLLAPTAEPPVRPRERDVGLSRAGAEDTPHAVTAAEPEPELVRR